MAVKNILNAMASSIEKQIMQIKQNSLCFGEHNGSITPTATLNGIILAFYIEWREFEIKISHGNRSVSNMPIKCRSHEIINIKMGFS